MSILTKTRGFGFGGGRIVFVNGFARNHHLHRPKRSMLFSSAATSTNPNKDASTTTTNERLFSEEINVLYDSKCNVCKLEMDWLVSRDIRLNGPDNRKLKLTDLEDANFDATDPSNGGIDYATGMAAIYAVTYDGSVYKGVPVFELAYEQVGLGWIWKITRIPWMNRVLEWGYEIFATNRTRFTRGASLEELLALKAAQQKAREQEDCQACNNILENDNNSNNNQKTL